MFKTMHSFEYTKNKDPSRLAFGKRLDEYLGGPINKAEDAQGAEQTEFFKRLSLWDLLH